MRLVLWSYCHGVHVCGAGKKHLCLVDKNMEEGDAFGG